MAAGEATCRRVGSPSPLPERERGHLGAGRPGLPETKRTCSKEPSKHHKEQRRSISAEASPAASPQGRKSPLTAAKICQLQLRPDPAK